MKPEEKSNIYDRLLSIKMVIDIQTVPNPRYINEKIGECRRYIEEVEKFMFQVSRESSAVQQAFNNSTAEFESKKEALLARDDIKGLPSIKDREAKANSLLKEEVDRIRGYQNESNDLNNLLRAVNLKMKNLNGANADIKMQLRIMESQIKLSAGPGTDVAMQSLMTEMAKSQIGKDAFEGVQTSAEETDIVDPTQPLDIQDMLKSENILENGTSEVTESEDDTEDESEEVIDTEAPTWNSFIEPQGGITETKEEDIPSIDLDKIIESNPEIKGGQPEPQKGAIVTKTTNPIESVVGTETQKSDKNQNQIDLDDLLDNITKGA